MASRFKVLGAMLLVAGCGDIQAYCNSGAHKGEALCGGQTFAATCTGGDAQRVGVGKSGQKVTLKVAWPAGWQLSSQMTMLPGALTLPNGRTVGDLSLAVEADRTDPALLIVSLPDTSTVPTSGDALPLEGGPLQLSLNIQDQNSHDYTILTDRQSCRLYRDPVLATLPALIRPYPYTVGGTTVNAPLAVLIGTYAGMTSNPASLFVTESFQSSGQGWRRVEHFVVGGGQLLSDSTSAWSALRMMQLEPSDAQLTITRDALLSYGNYPGRLDLSALVLGNATRSGGWAAMLGLDAGPDQVLLLGRPEQPEWALLGPNQLQLFTADGTSGNAQLTQRSQLSLSPELQAPVQAVVHGPRASHTTAPADGQLLDAAGLAMDGQTVFALQWQNQQLLPPRTATLTPGSTQIPVSARLALGDLDDDGLEDLVFVSSIGGPMQWAPQLPPDSGNLRFAALRQLFSMSFPKFINGIAVGDLNGDRKVDLAMAVNPGGINVYLGQ